MAIEELLGPLPAGWAYTTLGEACRSGGGDIQTGPFGSQLHASDYVPSGIPSIMPQNIGDNRIIEEGIARISSGDAQRLSRYLVRKGDIVYSRRGDVERRALIRAREEGWLCGTGCLRVRLGTGGVDPAYASFFLGHPSVREWIVRHAHGATMPNLNTSILSACPFVVPPPREQRAIAEVLGAFDDKIELNRRMSETLEGIARAIFKSWFVDFDPVRAKMEGRDPGLAPEIAALFPDRLVETDKGEIPEGWESRAISELADLNPESWSRADYPSQVEYVDLANTKWGEISDVQMFERADAPSRAQRVLRPGDTIVGTVRPGNGAYALIGREGLTGSTGFAVLRPKRKTDREFIYLAATQRSVIDHLAHLADGAAYPAVRPQVVAGVETTLADPDVRSAFSQITGPLLDRIELNRFQSGTLAALRDLLLPKLMSGEIRIRDAEKLLGEAGV
jgi:type I restriction enzyme S subunit